MYRAVLEGLALQSRMMLDGMTVLPGVGEAQTIRLIGGTSRNRLFLSIKASVFARPLLVVEEPEATALGAAMLGGRRGRHLPDVRRGIPRTSTERNMWSSPMPMRSRSTTGCELRSSQKSTNG